MPKDACYRKVKSRYKVFPSAYASGAIAKCRKVGASNWGNKKTKDKTQKVDGGQKNSEGDWLSSGGSKKIGWMSDLESPAGDAREKSEERPIADHQSV